MEFSIIALSILAAALVLFINYIIAKEFFTVANSKGYNDKKYLWYCFFFGIIGYLLAIALIDKNNAVSKNVDELPEI